MRCFLLSALLLFAGQTFAVEATAERVEFFSAIRQGKIDVKYIPVDESREAKLLIKNNGKAPLTLEMPDVFGAAPILAQGGLNGGGGLGNNNNNNNQNQQAGGGLGGGQGGFGGGQGGGAGLFNIAPEKVAEVKVPTVCLEHGKLEPSKYVEYQVKPITEVNSTPEVVEILRLLAAGKTNQRVAQAATWHYASKLSWEQLAAKKVNRLGKPDSNYYQPAELQAAVALSKHVEQVVAARRSAGSSSTAGE